MSTRFKKKPSYTLYEQHRWADYFELLCLSNIDGEIDVATMQDRVELKERDGVDMGFDDSAESSDDLDIEYLADGDVNQNEKWDLRFLDYFKHFKLRAAKFGLFYPFIIDGKKIVLKEGYQSSVHQKFYTYLLCCSSLSYFSDIQGVLTSDFEELCNLALTSMLPNNKTHTLGKTASGSARTYHGNVYDKLKNLADDLSVKLRVTREDFAASSSGDGGLDLISWYDFKDNTNSIPTFGGQCKCSPEWINAKDPSSLLQGYFDLDHQPTNMFFVPYYYRRSNGDWHQKQYVRNKIVFDRLRLCNLLRDELSNFESTNAFNSIEEFLREKENII